LQDEDPELEIILDQDETERQLITDSVRYYRDSNARQIDSCGSSAINLCQGEDSSDLALMDYWDVTCLIDPLGESELEFQAVYIQSGSKATFDLYKTTASGNRVQIARYDNVSVGNAFPILDKNGQEISGVLVKLDRIYNFSSKKSIVLKLCKERPPAPQVTFTSTPSGAKVYIDGSQTEAGTTPFTSTSLSQGSHTARFTRTGYQDCTRTFTVPSTGSLTVNCDMIESNNFQVTVTRAAANVTKVVVAEYQEIPDTPGHVWRGNIIASKTCPDANCTGIKFTEADGLTRGHSYLVYAADQPDQFKILSSSRVKTFTGRTPLTLTAQTGTDTILGRLCSFGGPSNPMPATDCVNWQGLTFAVDLLTPLGDAYRIFAGKDPYTGQNTTPDNLTYLSLIIGLFPLGGSVSKTAVKGAYKVWSRTAHLAALLKKYSTLARDLLDLNLARRLKNFTSTQFETLISKIKSGDTAGVKTLVRGVSESDLTNAEKATLKAALDDAVGTAKSDEVIDALKLVSKDFVNAYRDLLRGYLSGTATWTTSHTAQLLSKGANSPADFLALIRELETTGDLENIISKLSRAATDHEQVTGRMLDAVKHAKDIYTTDAKIEDYIKYGSELAQRSASWTRGQRDVAELIDLETQLTTTRGGAILVEETSGNTIAKELDNTAAGWKASTTESAWQTATQGRITGRIKRIRDWARGHPWTAIGAGGVSVMVVWFMVDNVPFYIYMALKAQGKAPGDVGFKAHDYMTQLRTVLFNARQACSDGNTYYLQSYLRSINKTLQDFKDWRDNNTASLNREQTLPLVDDSIAFYQAAISDLAKCLPYSFPLPATAKLENVLISHIIDGDSGKARWTDADNNVQEFEYRLMSINAPEKPYLGKSTVECTPEGSMRVDRAFYTAAYDLAVTELLNKRFTLKFNPDRPWDAYGRLLVWIEGGAYEEKILQEGLACYFHRVEWTLPGDPVDHSRLKAARDQAKNQRKGIWALQGDTATLNINTVPTAVSVFVNGTYRGKTVSNTLNGLKVPTGTLTVKFIKTGYESHTETVIIAKDETKQLTVTLTRIPTITDPDKANIWISSNPTGARIYIDGVDKHDLTPARSKGYEVDPGSHTIRLTKKGYQDHTETITLTKGQRWRKTVNLTKIQPPTPTVNTNVVINEFDPYGEWIELHNKGTTQADLTGWTLEDSRGKPEPIKGTIPAGGYLVLEKARKDYRFALNNSGDKVVLKAGATEIDRVQYGKMADPNDPGHSAPKPQKGKTIGRYPDGTGDWAVMQPSKGTGNTAPPPEPAWIWATSKPTGARIHIDGVDKHDLTPARRKGYTVPQGSHTLKLTKRGYNPWTKTLNLDPGERWRADILLIPDDGSLAESTFTSDKFNLPGHGWTRTGDIFQAPTGQGEQSAIIHVGDPMEDVKASITVKNLDTPTVKIRTQAVHPITLATLQKGETATVYLEHKAAPTPWNPQPGFAIRTDGGRFKVIGPIKAYKPRQITTANIIINEIDPYNEWIELRNLENSEVNLYGWTIEDSSHHPQSLKGTIPAGGYIVLERAARDYRFALNNSGDMVILKAGATEIDSIEYGKGKTVPAPARGQTLARIPDGTGDWTITSTPTKGRANQP